ncbi:glycosyl transferase family 1 [Arthrobacter sp. PGP41]|uniref:glycosyltransferase family 4 protein n=1 Tax=Arthrobacter sp. PGP41 TaxID=2079227 RepID=UPI000CDC0535|nr:glycosyltransferase family 4 protein [Arthrobacter sp. PGP41]AUZ35703.1 glycosyl transferase family 1 [Arthrobacter sp. PGP41]
MRATKMILATNNGDVGGGEVMLLALAMQARELGVSVSVVGPAAPSTLVEASRAAGHPTVVLPASSRAGYMVALRHWRLTHPDGLLWCNGLVPSAATALMGRRVVHLHQLPRGAQSILAGVARKRAAATLVPSRSLAARLPGSIVLENWVEEVRPARQPHEGAVRLGFLGRPSLEKGVGVLAAALQQLDAQTPGRYRLVLAGEPRFTTDAAQRELEQALAPVNHLMDRPGWMEPAKFFGAVDVMVCPSLVPESFGLVVAEAMSARVPFVISDAGALPEIAGPECPWVVPAGDAEELAKAIRKAVDDGGLVYVTKAYERWLSCFSPMAGGSRLEALLKQWGVIPSPSFSGGNA